MQPVASTPLHSHTRPQPQTQDSSPKPHFSTRQSGTWLVHDKGCCRVSATNRNCTAFLPKKLTHSLTQRIDRSNGDPSLWLLPSNDNHPHSAFNDINNNNNKDHGKCS